MNDQVNKLKQSYKYRIKAYVKLAVTVGDIRNKLKNNQIDLTYAQEELKSAKSYFLASLQTYV